MAFGAADADTSVHVQTLLLTPGTPSMTLNELKGKYQRLSVELDALDGGRVHSEAQLARLAFELEEIDREFVEFRRRAQAAPTLRDVVAWTESAPSRLMTSH